MPIAVNVCKCDWSCRVQGVLEEPAFQDDALSINRLLKAFEVCCNVVVQIIKIAIVNISTYPSCAAIADHLVAVMNYFWIIIRGRRHHPENIKTVHATAASHQACQYDR